MRIVLFFFLIISLQADYLNTKSNNHCIYNLQPNQNSRGWCYTDRNIDKDKCDRRLKMSDLIDGYYLDDNGNCVLEENLKITGLSANEWRFNMALMGNLVGFTLLFFISLLSIYIARK